MGRSTCAAGANRLPGSAVRPDLPLAACAGGLHRTKIGSSGYSVGSRVEVETSAVKVDSRFEVLSVPETVGHLLDGLDLGIETLGDGVGDAVGEEGQNVGQVALDHAGRVDPRRQRRVSG